ncbi:DeoR/GlpR family DNA-binding transcription regulator [Sphingomonas sp.]|uniref:DeoR/GlpR family DNA-binding transcription regulator n=1 Tax=Sphingomonas sp. TaxID=28214 RepID=UPI003D6C8FD8
MPDSLTPDQRRAQIMHKLAENDRVIARDLAEEFGTSEDSVRRDLRDLAAAGLCKRIYGGALSLSPAQGRFAERVDTQLAAKNALAWAALPLIENGQTLFIDSGSTNLMLADILPRDLNLTIVTNSVSIATTLLRRPGISLFLIGGQVDPDIDGAVGAQAIDQIGLFRPDLSIIGVCALDPIYGAAAFDPRDADFKRAAVAGANRIAMLSTADKLGTTAPHRIMPVKNIDHLVVEFGSPGDICTAFAAQGTTITTARPS